MAVKSTSGSPKVMTKPAGKGASGASSVAVAVISGVEVPVIATVATSVGTCSSVGVDVDLGVGVATTVGVRVGVEVAVGNS